MIQLELDEARKLLQEHRDAQRHYEQLAIANSGVVQFLERLIQEYDDTPGINLDALAEKADDE